MHVCRLSGLLCNGILNEHGNTFPHTDTHILTCHSLCLAHAIHSQCECSLSHVYHSPGGYEACVCLPRMPRPPPQIPEPGPPPPNLPAPSRPPPTPPPPTLPHPSPPPPFPPTETLCSDSCSLPSRSRYSADGWITRVYNNDDTCDDGGEGAEYQICELGTDCTDCGRRHVPWPNPPPLAPPVHPLPPYQPESS